MNETVAEPAANTMQTRDIDSEVFTSGRGQPIDHCHLFAKEVLARLKELKIESRDVRAHGKAEAL
jgi:hypothetical protein